MITLVGTMGITVFSGISQSVSVIVAKERDLASLALGQSFFLSLIFFIFFLVAVHVVPLLTSNLMPQREYLIYSGLVVLPSLVFNYLNGYFLGVGKIDRFNYLNFFQLFFTFVFLGFVLLLFHWQVRGALIGWISAYIASSILAFFWVRKEVKGFRVIPDAKILKKEVLFGLKIGGTNLVALLNNRFNIFLIGAYLGIAAVGVYSVAITLAESVWFFSTSLSVASFSRFGSVSGREAAELTAKGMRHLTFVICVTGVILFLISEWLIVLLFGKMFLPAARAFRLLLPGVAIYGLASLFSNYFTVQKGKPEISFYTCCFSATLGGFLNFLFIPALGLDGAAMGISIAYLVTMGIALSYLSNKTSFPLREFLIIKGRDFEDYKGLLGDILKSKS
jgi:O-antigen/teichoic acid export membrane protein